MPVRTLAIAFIVLVIAARIGGVIHATEFWIGLILGGYVFARERIHCWQLDRRSRR